MQARTLLLAAVVVCLAFCVLQEVNAAAKPTATATATAKAMANNPKWANARKRWGFWRFVRLKQRADELRSDLKAARKEFGLAKARGIKVCANKNKSLTIKLNRLRAKIGHWKKILNLRKAQAKYHAKRHGHYKKHHRFSKTGGKKRAVWIKSCKKSGKTRCGKRWCKSHKKACRRWRESRKEYLAGMYRHHLRAHGKTLRKRRSLIKKATAVIRKAKIQALRLQKKIIPAKQKRCVKRSKKVLAKFGKRVKKLKAALARTKKGFRKLKAKRSKRESKYRTYKFTRCKKWKGGKFSKRQYVYSCKRGKKATRKTFKFKKCRGYRRRHRRHSRKGHKSRKSKGKKRGRKGKRRALKCYK